MDTIADGAGFTKFTHGTGTNSVTLKAGYDNAYEVNLLNSTDTVDGTLYTGDMTVKFANMDHIDSGAVITGGTGTNDTLSIDATNTALTAAELANITKVENFVLKNDEATAQLLYITIMLLLELQSRLMQVLSFPPTHHHLCGK